MGVTTALAHAQAAAEARMLDACTVHRPQPASPEVDPETGRPVTPPPILVYAGRCRLHPLGRAMQPGGSGVGGDAVTDQVEQISIPVAGPELLVEDVITIVSAQRPVLVRKRFRVTGIPLGSQVSAQRYLLEAVTG